MIALSTDNRNMADIESELRARIEAQSRALETLRDDNRRLQEENRNLRHVLEGQRAPSPPGERALAHAF
jgi:hypothetical protein